jgi:anaerobic ribonucleoside-triphosphate reductase activating protein
MNIAHIHPHSEIYGPGIRMVIWTQGCRIRCPGCWNTAFWDFQPRQIYQPSELVALALASPVPIEGVTVLGGEPFDQYEDLLQFAQALYTTPLSLLLYTGYTVDQLEEGDKTAILHWTDILVEGPYLHAQRDTELLWRGSRNQVLHFLSPRYQREDYEEAHQIELLIHSDGGITTYGYPDSRITSS